MTQEQAEMIKSCIIGAFSEMGPPIGQTPEEARLELQELLLAVDNSTEEGSR